MKMAYPRYRFDHGFGRGVGAPAADAEATAAEAPDPIDLPRHSERALQAALAEARDNAFADGLARGRSDGERLAGGRIEARLAAALERLADHLAVLDAGHDAVMQRLETEGVQLLVALVRRLAPGLLDLVARAEVERLAVEALRIAGPAPILTVRLHPALLRPLEERLAGQTLFKGRLEIVADPAMTPGGLDAGWGAGGVRRDPAELDDAIAALTERTLASLWPEPVTAEGIDPQPADPPPSAAA